MHNDESLDMSSYPSAAIANLFLDLARAQGKPLTQMQIQKLVYFAHGWYLAFYGDPLCTNHAQAWQWGPVFPDLYHATKHFGNKGIDGPIRIEEDVVNGDSYFIEERTPTIPSDDFEAQSLVQRVWAVYGTFTAAQLSQMSHDPEGPWHSARAISLYSRGVDIKNDDIRTYFETKMNDNKQA